jgi:hypothetical protein
MRQSMISTPACCSAFKLKPVLFAAIVYDLISGILFQSTPISSPLFSWKLASTTGSLYRWGAETTLYKAFFHLFIVAYIPAVLNFSIDIEGAWWIAC